MTYVVSTQFPDGRHYVEARHANDTVWTNDPNKAKTFASKNGSDKHILLYKLVNAASTKVIVTDPSLGEARMMASVYTKAVWQGMHEIWGCERDVVLYVKRNAKSRNSGNYPVNEAAVVQAKSMAAARGVPCRILLGVDINNKTYNEISPDVLDRLSVRRGAHGNYWLISEGLIIQEQENA